jgi:hypothetical protein
MKLVIVNDTARRVASAGLKPGLALARTAGSLSSSYHRLTIGDTTCNDERHNKLPVLQ